MANFVYDKKQLPQVIVLGALSVGMFGYFGMRFITPPPTQAAPAPSVKPQTAATPNAPASTAVAGADVSDTDVTGLIGASAPSDAMRSPFTPGITAADAPPTAQPPQQVASARLPDAPTIPAVPGIGDVRPLPAIGSPLAAAQSPAPAAWIVTGIIRSDADPASAVAVFRQGDARRYVHLGDMVDDTTRLIGISRSGVTVLRGSDHIRLPLGGPTAAPVAAAPTSMPTGAFQPAAAPKLPKLAVPISSSALEDAADPDTV